MRKLSSSVNVTQLQLSAPPHTREGFGESSCSREGSPQHRAQPWALFLFFFNSNRSLWCPRPVATSLFPPAPTHPGDLAPSHTTAWSVVPPPQGVRNPSGDTPGTALLPGPHAPPAPAAPARAQGTSVCPKAGSPLPPPAGPGAPRPGVHPAALTPPRTGHKRRSGRREPGPAGGGARTRSLTCLGEGSRHVTTATRLLPQGSEASRDLSSAPRALGACP